MRQLRQALSDRLHVLGLRSNFHQQINCLCRGGLAVEDEGGLGASLFQFAGGEIEGPELQAHLKVVRLKLLGFGKEGCCSSKATLVEVDLSETADRLGL